jgi:hypothetical protein
MNPIISKEKTLACVTFTLAVILVTASISPAHAVLTAIWNTRDLTYRIVDCNQEFVPRIREGIALWQGWLPEVTFREVTQDEKITFQCFNTPDIDGAIADATVVSEPSTRIIQHATIRLPIWAFSHRFDIAGAGVNVVTHELGHAFGLDDWTGGIMCTRIEGGYFEQFCTLQTKEILTPTQEQLSELHAYYSSLPQPASQCRELVVATDKTDYVPGEGVRVAVVFAHLQPNCVEEGNDFYEIRLEVNGAPFHVWQTQRDLSESIIWQAQAVGTYVFVASEWLNGIDLELESRVNVNVFEPNTPPPNNSTPPTAAATSSSPRCIIATATYGSEMAPEVAYMRHVRDDLIGSTIIGRPIIQAWNAFYYSWSPPLAQAITASSTLQAFFRILLAPLTIIIHMAAATFTALARIPDFASVTAFLAAAIVSVLDYIITPACLIILAVRRGRPLR